MKETQNIKSEVVIASNKIHFSYAVLAVELEGGRLSCYIPSFDIAFPAKDAEESRIRGKILMRSFFDFWILKNSWSSFVINLNRLGFKSSEKHDFVLAELLKHRGKASLRGGSKISSPYENYVIQEEIEEVVEI